MKLWGSNVGARGRALIIPACGHVHPHRCESDDQNESEQAVLDGEDENDEHQIDQSGPEQEFAKHETLHDVGWLKATFLIVYIQHSTFQHFCQ